MLNKGDLKVEETAPDFTLTSVQGSSISLNDVLKKRCAVLLVFLRHLGWLVCAEHVAQLCQQQEELKRLNTEVLLISFGQPEEAGKWRQEVCSSFQLLLDPERRVYHSYNLKHSWLGSWNLKTLVYYVKALSGGTELRGITGDSAQLGGDFIIGRDRRFLLKHPSQEATDRPKVSDILGILRENCRWLEGR